MERSAQPAIAKFNSQEKILMVEGDWTLENIRLINEQLQKISWPKTGEIIVQGKQVRQLDSAGAWMLITGIKERFAPKVNLRFEEFSEQHQKLFGLYSNEESAELPPAPIMLDWIQRLGRFALLQVGEFYEFCNFVGKLFFETLRILFNPFIWRWTSFVSVINQNGTQALPIIALLSFMIGVVISYQMGNELQKYGANIFIVNLLGFSILREFGPLLAAIMVAGRTGSAFAAQLGTMKINQEIDALNTMGLPPEQLIIIPRLAGLFIVLPLLTIWADFFGILGGILMAQNFLHMSWFEFLHRFQREIPVRNLIIGIGKAPVFALIIASIGCFQGMKVQGSSVSVGARTTRSVVLAIFFIILANAFFSLLLSKYKL